MLTLSISRFRDVTSCFLDHCHESYVILIQIPLSTVIMSSRTLVMSSDLSSYTICDALCKWQLNQTRCKLPAAVHSLPVHHDHRGLMMPHDMPITPCLHQVTRRYHCMYLFGISF